MPTGYTHGVSEGTITTFEQFAEQCMRAFGACIMQRDDPMSDKPKLRTPDTSYHSKELKRARAQLRRAKKVKASILALRAIEQAQNDHKYHTNKIAEEKVIFKRYSRMLEDAEAWVPPTPEHENFKKFMIEQLRDSIKHDCSGNYHERELQLAVSRLLGFNAKENRAELIETANRDIQYHLKEIAEERRRVKESNDWIMAIYNSLHAPKTHSKSS
jgi:hypothetical protein